MPRVNEYAYVGVPKTGDVWCGQVITAPRRAVMLRYQWSHQWLFFAGKLAGRWTAKERTLFRKWQADFMRPMNGKASKAQGRAR